MVASPHTDVVCLKSAGNFHVPSQHLKSILQQKAVLTWVHSSQWWVRTSIIFGLCWPATRTTRRNNNDQPSMTQLCERLEVRQRRRLSQRAPITQDRYPQWTRASYNYITLRLIRSLFHIVCYLWLYIYIYNF